jgi:hypothetical protein
MMLGSSFASETSSIIDAPDSILNSVGDGLIINDGWAEELS